MDKQDLTAYYKVIEDRGWGCWLHGMKAGFIPKVLPTWTKRTHKVSDDRQVTVAWDPAKFTDEIGDQQQLVEVYRNKTHRVVLFPVA